jgi:uncharacterized low-complexity protein
LFYTDCYNLNLHSALFKSTIRESVMNRKINKLSLAAGAALTMVVAGNAQGAQEQEINPFGVTRVTPGEQQAPLRLADADKAKEGSCGGMKDKEGSCGANKKAKEGKCGADKKAKEGKCGADKKAREGKCGADKAKEGSCGGMKDGGKS